MDLSEMVFHKLRHHVVTTPDTLRVPVLSLPTIVVLLVLEPVHLVPDSIVGDLKERNWSELLKHKVINKMMTNMISLKLIRSCVICQPLQI